MAKGIEINGNVNNIQIQQNCNNSTMNVQINNDVQYFIKAQEVVDSILQYDSDLSIIFENRENEVRSNIKMAQEGIDQKNKPLISRAFDALKRIAASVPSNIIAAGLMKMITEGGF